MASSAQTLLLQPRGTMPVTIEYNEAAPADAWRGLAELPTAELSRAAPAESRVTQYRKCGAIDWPQKHQLINTVRRKNGRFGKPRLTRQSPIPFRRVIQRHQIPTQTMIQSSSMYVPLLMTHDLRTP